MKDDTGELDTSGVDVEALTEAIAHCQLERGAVDSPVSVLPAGHRLNGDPLSGESVGELSGTLLQVS